MATLIPVRLTFILLQWTITLVIGWQICNNTGAICPNDNLCCGSNLCLSGVDGTANGSTCCVDNDDDNGNTTTTGCGINYICSKTDTNMCTAIDPEYDIVPDHIPRNILCKVTRNMTHIYAIPIMDQISSSNSSSLYDNTDDITEIPTGSTKRHNISSSSMIRSIESRKRQQQGGLSVPSIPTALYLSSLGPIHENDDSSIYEHIEHVILLIHGSRRNVEDYLCCTMASIPSYIDPESVLFIAPWFVTEDDNVTNVTYTSSQTYISDQMNILHWIGNSLSDTIFHTWRYGANAINANVSSYHVVDYIVQQYLYNTTKFPSLRTITLTGHSAGGQYVQRYALLSNIIQDNTATRTSFSSSNTTNYPKFRTVVANPKSYAYFDDRRWMMTSSQSYNNMKRIHSQQNITKKETLMFRTLTKNEIHQCPTYNDWEWGLNVSKNSDISKKDTLVAPYVLHAIEVAGGINNIIHRYMYLRHVIYLSGEYDVLYNGNCNDQIQGMNRYVRSERYYHALQQIHVANSKTKSNAMMTLVATANHHAVIAPLLHERYIVPNVPHDHCLMYQSEQGQLALYGPFRTTTNITSDA